MIKGNATEVRGVTSARVRSFYGEVFDWSRMYQIGLVVNNLEKTKGIFESLGLGQLTAPVSRRVVAREVFGETIEAFEHRTARLDLTDQLEMVVMQPSQHPGPQRLALDERGAHVFHLCFYTDDIRSAISAMEKRGAPVISWGRFDDGGEYAVFGTAEQIGVNLELYQTGSAVDDADR